MRLALLRKIINDVRWLLLGCVLTIFAFAWIRVAIVASMETQQLQRIARNLPEMVKRLHRFGSSATSATSPARGTPTTPLWVAVATPLASRLKRRRFSLNTSASGGQSTAAVTTTSAGLPAMPGPPWNSYWPTAPPR